MGLVLWRLVFFIAVAFTTSFLLGAAARMVAWPTPASAQLAGVFILPLGVLFAHAMALRVNDRRGWDYVGLDGNALALRPIALGGSLGALAITAPTLILLFAKQYEIVPAPDGSWIGATLFATAVLLPAALWEELLFRGYAFSVLRESIGWKSALLITSILFGMAHLNNTAADVQNIIIVITAGFFLGMIRLATKSLYAAWAAHFAWNWVMACGFHVSVSGNPFERPDYGMVPTGPAWLTGGGWGPEGGLGAAIGLFAVVFYVYGRYLKRLDA